MHCSICWLQPESCSLSLFGQRIIYIGIHAIDHWMITLSCYGWGKCEEVNRKEIWEWKYWSQSCLAVRFLKRDWGRSKWKRRRRRTEMRDLADRLFLRRQIWYGPPAIPENLWAEERIEKENTQTMSHHLIYCENNLIWFNLFVGQISYSPAIPGEFMDGRSGRDDWKQKHADHVSPL